MYIYKKTANASQWHKRLHKTCWCDALQQWTHCVLKMSTYAISSWNCQSAAYDVCMSKMVW